MPLRSLARPLQVCSVSVCLAKVSHYVCEIEFTGTLEVDLAATVCDVTIFGPNMELLTTATLSAGGSSLGN